MNMAGNQAPHLSAEQLRLYALGLLDPAHQQRVEAHLPACPACRETVASQQAELVRAVESLAPPGPLPLLRVSRQVRPPRRFGWPPAAAAAVLLAVLAAASLGWNVQQSAARTAERQQSQLVSRWLTRPDVRLVALTDLKRQPSGKVLVSSGPAAEALFVLPGAPAGYEYRAWVARDWHLGEQMRLARQSRGGAYVVALADNDYLCLSLERPGTPPTRPTRILGKAFF